MQVTSWNRFYPLPSRLDPCAGASVPVPLAVGFAGRRRVLSGILAAPFAFGTFFGLKFVANDLRPPQGATSQSMAPAQSLRLAKDTQNVVVVGDDSLAASMAAISAAQVHPDRVDQVILIREQSPEKPFGGGITRAGVPWDQIELNDPEVYHGPMGKVLQQAGLQPGTLHLNESKLSDAINAELDRLDITVVHNTRVRARVRKNRITDLILSPAKQDSKGFLDFFRRPNRLPVANSVVVDGTKTANMFNDANERQLGNLRDQFPLAFVKHPDDSGELGITPVMIAQNVTFEDIDRLVARQNGYANPSLGITQKYALLDLPFAKDFNQFVSERDPSLTAC